jgi:hypothetical protein
MRPVWGARFRADHGQTGNWPPVFGIRTGKRRWGGYYGSIEQAALSEERVNRNGKPRLKKLRLRQTVVTVCCSAILDDVIRFL